MEFVCLVRHHSEKGNFEFHTMLKASPVSFERTHGNHRQRNFKRGDSVYDDDSLIIIRLDSQIAYIARSYFTVMFHEYIS